MPENTKAQARRRRRAIQSAVLSALWQGVTAGFLLWMRQAHFPAGPFSTLLLVLAILDLAMLIPLGVSLRARLKEIEGGEEDEASQY